MIGFVLSGGANRGPLQVGALQSLVAHGIKANLVAGTSAGALNGVYYAFDPTAAGMEQLAQQIDHGVARVDRAGQSGQRR
jgi:NTE family protein